MNKIFNRTFSIAAEALKDSERHGVRRLSAGLSYYLLFSLAPLLILSVMMGAVFVGGVESRTAILSVIENLFGEQIGILIKSMISESIFNNTDIVAASIAVVLILWGASRFIVHLNEALEVIFEINSKNKEPVIRETIKKRIRSFIYLIPTTILILLVFLLSLLLPFVVEAFSGLFPIFPKEVFFYIQIALIFALMILVFAVVYKALSPAEIDWKSAFFGSAVASLVFIVIQTLFSLYVTYASGLSLYGALGSLFALLIWTYWSAIGFLYGAEAARVSMNESVTKFSLGEIIKKLR